MVAVNMDHNDRYDGDTNTGLAAANQLVSKMTEELVASKTELQASKTELQATKAELQATTAKLKATHHRMRRLEELFMRHLFQLHAERRHLPPIGEREKVAK
jgi:septal ring factor EnvC (AmiA/AmiB activator)